MANSTPFLFVSHVSEDRAAALEIVHELERRGVPCWIAPRNVEPGKPFDDEIADALDRCRAMLLIFSEHCNESEYMRREVTVAGESHKVIIPFRIEDAQPRRGLRVRLSDLHWIDAFASRERALDELADRFAPSAAEESESAHEVGQPPRVADEPRREQQDAHQARAGAAERDRQRPEPDGEPPRRKTILIGAGIAAAILVGIVGLVLSGVFATPPTAGQSFHDCRDCPEMVVVPAGQFMMGSSESETDRFPNEGPRRPVTIKVAFAVGKYDVTRAEYAIFAQATSRGGASGCPPFSQTDRDPVVCVNWDDAEAYAAWLSKTTGKGYRLLTEAEWEYAARAGTTTARYWGDAVGRDNANCDGCDSRWGGKGTSPVGSFAPNPFGLYDMLGNAWQWVEDCNHDTYADAPGDGTAWVSGWNSGACAQRIFRGGSWINNPRNVRAADRGYGASNSRSGVTGFRVARATIP